MRSKMVLGVAIGCLVSALAYAQSGCDPALREEYRQCARIVDTLRPEKNGQSRVFAVDGSEFTAGEALWMRGQLRKFERLCAQGGAQEQAEAAKVLADVEELLKAHQRA